MGAVGAGHEVATLVSLGEEALDAAEVFDGWRRAGDDLAVPVILGSADAELDLVALGAGRGWVAVGLVEEHDAAADTTEATRRVGADETERAARKLLLQNRISTVLGFRITHQTA